MKIRKMDNRGSDERTHDEGRDKGDVRRVKSKGEEQEEG